MALPSTTKTEHNGAKDSSTDKWEHREALKKAARKHRRQQDRRLGVPCAED